MRSPADPAGSVIRRPDLGAFRRGVCHVLRCPYAGDPGVPVRLYPRGWLCDRHAPGARWDDVVVAAVPTPATAEPAAAGPWPVPDPPTRAYNPQSQRHTWTRVREHNRVCGYCLVWMVNETEDGRRWWQTWTWPSGRTGTNADQRSPKLPRCPGPARKDPDGPGKPDAG